MCVSTACLRTFPLLPPLLLSPMPGPIHGYDNIPLVSYLFLRGNAEIAGLRSHGGILW